MDLVQFGTYIYISFSQWPLILPSQFDYQSLITSTHSHSQTTYTIKFQLQNASHILILDCDRPYQLLSLRQLNASSRWCINKACSYWRGSFSLAPPPLPHFIHLYYIHKTNLTSPLRSATEIYLKSKGHTTAHWMGTPPMSAKAIRRYVSHKGKVCHLVRTQIANAEIVLFVVLDLGLETGGCCLGRGLRAISSMWVEEWYWEWSVGLLCLWFKDRNVGVAIWDMRTGWRVWSMGLHGLLVSEGV